MELRPPLSPHEDSGGGEKVKVVDIKRFLEHCLKNEIDLVER